MGSMVLIWIWISTGLRMNIDNLHSCLLLHAGDRIIYDHDLLIEI